jgi:hypothetical protein
MTCSEYMAIQQLNAAFDTIESAFTSPEELSAADRMNRVAVVA